MAEETAKDGVSAAVRQLLRERAREGKAAAPPTAVEPGEPAESETVSTPEQLSLSELKEALQREWYGILLEPKVRKAIRRTLLGKDRKASRELLATMVSALMPHEKHGSGAPAKVVFISRIDRSGVNTTAAKIETPS